MARKLKIFSVAALFMAVLSGCGSAPVIKADPVQGTLKNESAVNLHLQKTPVTTAVRFNATGYTIFGAMYVAAAVSKMNTQSDQMNAAINDHVKKNPEIGTLQSTFNEELEKILAADGVSINKVSAEKKVSDAREISYTINPAETMGKQTVIVDGLTTIYFAPSSTDPYRPQAAVLISVMNSDGLSAKPMKQEEIMVTLNGTHIYDDYSALSKDVSTAYAGLQESAKQLAQKVADSLLGRLTAAEQTKMAKSN